MMNERTITVKGTGRAALKADWIVFSVQIETRDLDYSVAMNEAERRLAEIQEAAGAAGFKPGDLKTTAFTINPEYEQEYDEAGHYQSHFKGFLVHQGLQISFKYNMVKLSEILEVITHCSFQPLIDISFSVHNKEKASELLLKKAGEDARKKAEILVASGGVRLGELKSIEYGFEDKVFLSNTRLAAVKASKAVMDIVPEDIAVEETVTFVWMLK